MSNQSLVARHYRTGEPVRVTCRSGVIASVEPAGSVRDPDLWIAPGLVDLQVNGFAGVDFQRDDLAVSDLVVAVRGLRAAGCTRFLLTLITDDWGRLLRRLERLRALRSASPELRRAIAGWHVEGPFLSVEPGYCGAHDPAQMLDPSPIHMEEMRSAAGDDPVLLTLAPERVGAVGAIRRAVALGMRVSLGHTNASAAQLRAAVEAGATGFTHLGNACPQQLDRHDNIVWRVLDARGLGVSLIPDGLHVAPELFRLVHRARGGEPILYVSDAMSAAGAGPGRYRLGRLALEVGEDGVVRVPGSSHFAGSALRPLEGVTRAAGMLGRGWREVWDAASTVPAGHMGWPAGLVPGGPGDFCLVRSPGGREVAGCRTVAGGDFGA